MPLAQQPFQTAITISRTPLHNEVIISMGLLQLWAGSNYTQVQMFPAFETLVINIYQSAAKLVMILDLLCQIKAPREKKHVVIEQNHGRNTNII